MINQSLLFYTVYSLQMKAPKAVGIFCPHLVSFDCLTVTNCPVYGHVCTCSLQLLLFQVPSLTQQSHFGDV